MILLEFIANRANSKQMFLQVLKDLLAAKALTIRQTAQVFNRIVEIPGTAFITTKGRFLINLLINQIFRTKLQISPGHRAV
jgi:hypothetical protein